MSGSALQGVNPRSQSVLAKCSCHLTPEVQRPHKAAIHSTQQTNQQDVGLQRNNTWIDRILRWTSKMATCNKTSLVTEIHHSFNKQKHCTKSLCKTDQSASKDLGAQWCHRKPTEIHHRCFALHSPVAKPNPTVQCRQWFHQTHQHRSRAKTWCFDDCAHHYP